MTPFEMAEFMRQHRFNFGWLEARKQGVEKNDPLGLAETSKISIAMAAAARSIHYEKTAGFETALSHQLLDAFLERGIFKWSELVENRRYPGWKNGENHQVEGHPCKPGIKPPVRPGFFHQP